MMNKHLLWNYNLFGMKNRRKSRNTINRNCNAVRNENLMSGLLPERQYKQLMKQYDDEQAELETKMETMKTELAEEKVSSVDIKHFISLIRKCKNPTEISDTMFNELVDKIVVYEAEGVGKARTQKVDIYFNYVGQVDIAYTEEELAEIERAGGTATLGKTAQA